MELKALVVDDSGIMRKLVMRSLVESKLATFMFSEAKDGQDALTQLEGGLTTDMMFVDWNMPNMTGIELVMKVRASEKSHTPIVMITTEGTMGKVEEALNQGGVDCYIVKPFTTDIVRQKLQPLMDKVAESRKKPSGFFGKLASKFA